MPSLTFVDRCIDLNWLSFQDTVGVGVIRHLRLQWCETSLANNKTVYIIVKNLLEYCHLCQWLTSGLQRFFNWDLQILECSSRWRNQNHTIECFIVVRGAQLRRSFTTSHRMDLVLVSRHFTGIFASFFIASAGSCAATWRLLSHACVWRRPAPASARYQYCGFRTWAHTVCTARRGCSLLSSLVISSVARGNAAVATIDSKVMSENKSDVFFPHTGCLTLAVTAFTVFYTDCRFL